MILVNNLRNILMSSNSQKSYFSKSYHSFQINLTKTLGIEF